MHILVVDDERIIADTLGLILKSRGFDATVTYSGEDALNCRHIEPRQYRPGLIDAKKLAIL